MSTSPQRRHATSRRHRYLSPVPDGLLLPLWIEDERLCPSDRAVVLYLCSHGYAPAGDSVNTSTIHVVGVGVGQLAKATGYHRGTINNALDRLQELGAILKQPEPRTDGAPVPANRYLIYPDLAEDRRRRTPFGPVPGR